MQPEISVNYLAVAVCVLVAMPVGFLWFGPLFGKAWAKHMGMEDMEQPDGAAMTKSMVIYAFGSLLIAFVLTHRLVMRPEAQIEHYLPSDAIAAVMAGTPIPR